MIPLSWKIGAGVTLVAVVAAAAWVTNEINKAERRGAVRAIADSVQARADRVLADSGKVWQARDSAQLALIDSLTAAQEAQDSTLAETRIVRERADSAAEDPLLRLEAVARDSGEVAVQAEDIAAVLGSLTAVQDEAEACGLALGTCQERLDAQRVLFEADSVRMMQRVAELRGTIRDLQASLNETVDVMDSGSGPPVVAVALGALGGVALGLLIALLAGG